MALQDTALRLIQKFGDNREVTLQVPKTVPADPTKPWEVDPTSSTRNLKVPAVVVPIARSMVDGSSRRQGDETVIIAGLSLGTTVPSTADKILDEKVEKNILDVERIRPGKTDFLYKLQVRAP